MIRVRLDYPALRRKVVEVYRQWPRPTLLIEDAGSGTSFIQDLKDQNIRAIPIKAEGDKVVRMAAQSAKIEAGEVYLPRHAKWLDDLRTEILAFPNGVHDDQVDSISQALILDVSAEEETLCRCGLDEAYGAERPAQGATLTLNSSLIR